MRRMRNLHHDGPLVATEKREVHGKMWPPSCPAQARHHRRAGNLNAKRRRSTSLLKKSAAGAEMTDDAGNQESGIAASPSPPRQPRPTKLQLWLHIEAEDRPARRIAEALRALAVIGHSLLPRSTSRFVDRVRGQTPCFYYRLLPVPLFFIRHEEVPYLGAGPLGQIGESSCRYVAVFVLFSASRSWSGRSARSRLAKLGKSAASPTTSGSR